uniref:Transferrin-a n=1 Tax=Callorhinchus milii TaxID=7868 RepID=A0A4W3I7P4_CALMI
IYLRYFGLGMSSRPLSSAVDPTIRWCTTSAQETKKCEDLKKSMATQHFSFSCVERQSVSMCLTDIATGVADAITVDGGDIYKAGLSPTNLKPIIAENITGESCYYAVAVVKKGSGFMFHELARKKSCHTGLGKSAGWNIPVGTILEHNLTQWEADQPIERVMQDFFSASCVPGADKKAFPKLCQLCIGLQENHCKRSHVEPYYDYSGAFRCLKEDAGQVAFVKHTTVPQSVKQSYELLCLDKTRRSVDDYKLCHLARVPAHAVVARSKTAADAQLIEDIWRFLSIAQKSFQLFESSKYKKKDLLFKDSVQSLIHLPKGIDYRMYLGSEYVKAIAALRRDEIKTTAKSKIRWCTIGQLDQRKCDRWVGVDCIAGVSADDCIKKITLREADAVSLDGGLVYVAGKCGLVPVMGEYYGKNATMCNPEIGATLTPSYYSVAVVKDRSLRLDLLKGKKSCHTGIGRSAGWNVPMGYLVQKKAIKPCEIFNSTYFSESCAPGADVTSKLCSLCVGRRVGLQHTDKCAGSSNEEYSGYSGAFRCLVEAGDVAFVKHTTVTENTDGNGKADWNRQLKSKDYALLCSDGSVKSIADYKTCYLAKVPAHAVISRPESRKAVLRMLKAQQMKHGRGGTEEKTFSMFKSSQFSGKDLLFKDSTQCLVEVFAKDYKSFLGPQYVKAMEGLNSCQPSELLEACSFNSC